MVRNKGTFQFAANFEIKNAAALDPRMVVATKAELYNKETWPYDGDTAYLYNGLVVAVTEENELYMLIDSENYTSESAWKKIGGGKQTVVEDSLDSTSAVNALSANQGRALKEMIEALPAYEIEKTDEGYKLVTEQGGDALGAIISFSDLVVKSGEVVYVEDVPVIKLTLTNDEEISIPATALVDVYTSNDKYINVTSDNKIGLNVDVLKADLNIPADLSEEVAALTAAIGNAEDGLVKDVADHAVRIGSVETALTSKVEVSTFNTLQAAVAGNTSDIEAVEGVVEEITEKVSALEGKVDVDSVSTAISEAIAPFRVKGLVADGNKITVTESSEAGVYSIGINGFSAEEITYVEGTSVKAKLDALNDAIESAVAGGVVGITAGAGIAVDTTSSTTMPTVGIKVKQNSALVADADGLDIIWGEFFN
jgi:hypothetical protein